MMVAVAGMGGSGMTTIAGTLARVMADRGQRVVAIDDDSNPNLALTLGAGAAVSGGSGIPRDLLEERTDAEGNKRLELSIAAEDFIDRFGVPVQDNLTLLIMGQPSHGGSG